MADNSAYQLTHKITIQQDTSDGTGDPDWQDLYQGIWAGKLGNTGKRFYAAAAANSSNDTVFTIRWTKARAIAIRPTMRLIADGDTDHPLDVTSLPVDVGDEHKWLQIHAQDTRINAG